VLYTLSLKEGGAREKKEEKEKKVHLISRKGKKEDSYFTPG